MLEKIREKWDEIKERVRDEYDITNVSYNTWIIPLEVYDLLDDHTLQVVYTDSTDDFAVNYITKRYGLFFKVMIEEITGYNCQIEFITQPKNVKSNLFQREVRKEEPEPRSYYPTNLNPRYTFDTFVVGSNNNFAHAASLSVAESPGHQYNPLFIYGGPGLGKTHLMHAIAHFILQNNHNAKVLYVTSEIFTNEVIDAIMNRNGVAMSDFRNKYRNIDMLLIDDIQFIIGKNATEEEFFNTFNFLHENGKHIVISSDKPPKDFNMLPERLKSRFEMGLTVDITSPDYETRMAILRKKEEMEGYTIDNEILQYIATNIKTNIRELEGALTKMYAYSKLHPNTPLTLDVAKENLKDIINPNNEKLLSPDHIIEVVAEHFNIKPEDIKSKRKTKEIVVPRQISMYLIRVMNDISLQDVGKFLGNRDHSTVIYGYEKILTEIKNSKDMENTIEILKKKLMQ